MRVTIKRLSEDRYSAVTDVLMSDGSYRADHLMRLDGSVLRSHEQPGCIRVGGLLRFNLGPVSLAAVRALAVDESVSVG